MSALSLCASKRVVSLTASLSTIFIFCLLAQPGFAQQPASAETQFGSQPLITQPIDETRLTVLKGNTHRLAQPQFDLGPATATLAMNRMQLVLKRSASQEFALRTLLDDQQDKRSANYHKWVTPEAFGKQFGPSDSDVQIITSWLQSHGFQVGTTKGRTVLEFSGSASQVQEAFHTVIHRYVVNGEEHWANASDPAIPAALTPAVAGVLTLHNFFKKPALRMLPQPFRGKIQPGKKPALTFSDGSHGMAPADFATIYNSAPLYVEVPTPINGSGVTIGVIGRSNLYSVDNADEDVTDFRSTFDISQGGNFTVILNGPDPGDLGGGDEAEATLDSSWTAGVAPFANVDFVVSASTDTSDGTDLSEIYIIENNLADVMTESFGLCELDSTSAQSLAYSQLAEQAAAQGITFFVSTGDSGAEGCDDPDTETVATNPVSVSVQASTPFNVAVGGTLFNDAADPTKYWSTSTTAQETALSYIPEDVWNDSCLSASCGGNANIAAGGGGASIYVSRPSWQTGVNGNFDANNMRDLPDVSLNADPHDGYVLCLEGSCNPNAQGEFNLYLVGGTSASTPSFAGIMSLIDQEMATTNPSGGVRQGHANYILYKLAATENSAFSTCNGSSTTTSPASTCIFNDVTVGNNAVPGEQNYGLTTAQYQAGVGYDMATGLGSVNIANLVAKWNSVTFNPTTTTLTIPQSTIVHGSSVPVTIAVAPTTGTGVPTGDVSLLTSANNDAEIFDNSAGMFTLSAGSVASSTNNLPGGAYFVEAYYAGDSTFASSYSASTFVNVTPEPSTTTLSALTINSSDTAFIPFAGGPFGSFVYLRADVAGVSQHGTPTGSVTFSDTFGPINGGGAYALNSGDAYQTGAYTTTPNGVLFDTGNHALTASYPGDQSFSKSTSSPPISFSITPGFFVETPGNAETTVTISAPGASGSTTVSVAYSTGFSGTISLACSGLPAGAACSFSPSTIAATGKLSTVPSTLTVTTTAAATADLHLPKRQGFKRWVVFSGFMLFSVVIAGFSGRKRLPLYTLGLLAMILFVPGCGGGGHTSTPPPVTITPTPAGTTTVTVTATSGSSVSGVPFVLSVQ